MTMMARVLPQPNSQAWAWKAVTDASDPRVLIQAIRCMHFQSVLFIASHFHDPTLFTFASACACVCRSLKAHSYPSSLGPVCIEEIPCQPFLRIQS